MGRYEGRVIMADKVKEGPEKAIVAGLVAMIMIFLADQGWHIDEGTVVEVVQSIVGGIATGVLTYWKRNSAKV